MPIEELEGYAQFQRDTKTMMHDLPDAVRQASLEIANEWVAAASARAQTNYAQEAARSFQISDDADGATLTNDSVVFFGSEFGGQARPETMQFPPHNGRVGYWFYPARRDNDERFMGIWDKGVEQGMREWNRHG